MVGHASKVEMEILSLLQGGTEMYGLEMVKTSSALKRGTIYVTLDRMAAKGLVKSRREGQPGMPGLPRRLYSITGHGVAVMGASSAYRAAFTGESFA